MKDINDIIFNKIDLVSMNANGFVYSMIEENVKLNYITILDLTNVVLKLKQYMWEYLISVNVKQDPVLDVIVDNLVKIFIEYYVTEQLFVLINADGEKYGYVTSNMGMDIVEDLLYKLNTFSGGEDTVYWNILTANKTYFINATLQMLEKHRHEDMGEILKLNRITNENDFTLPISWFNHSDMLKVGAFERVV